MLSQWPKFSLKDLCVVSGGTDNHLMLLDLSQKRITGKLAEESLGKANITVNKNQYLMISNHFCY